MNLSGKVALVTGASRGIGKAVALKLAQAGADLIVTATSLERAEKTAEVFGRLDFLVNNAGITRDGLLMRMKDADWDAVVDTNLKGAFVCTREAIKLMGKAKGGSIVNISSVVGEMGNAGQANYCASKAGLIGFTKAVAREYARRNITVNAITPGFIETDMTDVLSASVKEDLLKQIPVGRLGKPEDIANAVLFLVSDMGSYITGHVLSVNGGMYM
jgi:3-oxoacyl-[acyl-carrier protein] reductase